jgi:hypothetical protein
MTAIQVPAAGPLLVARVNPTPRFAISDSSGSSVTVGDMDVSHWTALPLYDLTLQPYNFLRSNIAFSSDDARNFYQLNPTNYSALIGVNNTSNLPFPFQFVFAADPASIQRYGFRPELGTTRWLWDPQGTAAQNQNLNVQDTVLQLLGAMISWNHPAPLMAQAEVTLPLTPSILIGTRFRYAPFKNGETWDFYVERVVHRFIFGGNSTTRLLLSRGLPTAVYDDSGSDGLLKAVYTGNAMRQGGVYTSGLPSGSSSPLEFAVNSQQAISVNGQLATIFVTPQANTTAASG